jgi:hypothetical protein
MWTQDALIKHEFDLNGVHQWIWAFLNAQYENERKRQAAQAEQALDH